MSTTASGAPAVALDDELVAALARLGREADAVTVLTPATARKFDRLTLRVDLRGGAAVKARRLESPADRARARPAPAAARLGLHGRARVRGANDRRGMDRGRPARRTFAPTSSASRRRARSSAGFTGSPSGTTGELETGAFLAAAVNDLGECRSDGVLTEDEVHRLSEMVHRLDPGSTPQSLDPS